MDWQYQATQLHTRYNILLFLSRVARRWTLAYIDRCHLRAIDTNNDIDTLAWAL